MSLIKRRPSLLGGVLWTGLGLLFLIRNFGYGPDFWRLAVRYWPILLILVGLGKVIDYYRQKQGVSLRVGEVIGILLLIIVGSFASRVSSSPGVREFIADLPLSIGGTQVRIGDWPGTSYTFTEEASYPLPSPTPIRVENSYGSVTVSPGSDREVRVLLRKVVFQDVESRAKEIAGEIKLEGGPVGSAESSSFLIKTNRDTLASKEYRFRTELEVQLPKKAKVELRNAYGEVRVANLDGKLDVATSHKQLEIRDCTGDVVASNRYADSRLVNLAGKLTVDARGRVYVEGIRGDVDVRNEYAPVEVRDVEGTLSVTNTESSILIDKVSKPVVVDARGSTVTVQNVSAGLKITASHRRVKVSDVTGNVALDTRYATVSISNVKGNVDLTSNSDRINVDDLRGAFNARGTGSSVRAASIAGPVDISTTLKEVIVNDFSASCKVTNEYADVSLSADGPLQGAITAKNRNGNVELFLPEEAAFQIEATARNGRVDSGFPGLDTPERSGDSATLRASVRSGGPKVVLDTEYSNIRIRTRGNESRKERRRIERERVEPELREWDHRKPRPVERDTYRRNSN
jgi:hypothetical protein